MVTQAQLTAFFTSPDQLGIPAATYAQMQLDGITTFEDLLSFRPGPEDVKRIAEDLRRPSGRIPDPTAGVPGGAPAGATIPTPPFAFPIKPQIRLEEAIELAHFYSTIGRSMQPGDMMYHPVINNFKELWRALKEKAKKDQPEVPKLAKGVSFVKWIESFKDHCLQCFGSQCIPLAAVIRENAEVPAVCPPRAQGQPYTEVFGSIASDLINRSSHTRGNFAEDNAAVYFKIEEATRNTTYHDSIAPFKRNLDGRGAYMALKNQYAGKDKWEAIIAKHKEILTTRVWKGNSNFTLESFVQQHRTAYIQMAAAAEHVPQQLPDGYTRVTDLFAKIQCDDAGLQAAIAHVENDDHPGGKRHDFEAAVSYLLPKDPVAKRAISSGNKRNNASVSDVTAETASVGAKPGIGVTGVHLRFHTNKEYAKLNNDQRNELREYRDKNPDKMRPPAKKQKTNGKEKRKKAFAAAVEKAVNKHLEEHGQTPSTPGSSGQISAIEQARNLLNGIVGSGSNQGGNVSSLEVQEQAASDPVADVAATEVDASRTRQEAFQAAAQRVLRHRYH